MPHAAPRGGARPELSQIPRHYRPRRPDVSPGLFAELGLDPHASQGGRVQPGGAGKSRPPHPQLPEGGGRLYDRFRGRVLFAIRDAQGRPVGLGGRVLPESGSKSPAKYVNSPETPLFSKSSLLYGLDVAKDAIRKSHTAMVMEGYTDTIVAHQHGFQDAVAVLGTALGLRHIQTLRFADQILLVLDGDDAGQRRRTRCWNCSWRKRSI